jgi:hypothetical protein
MEPIGLAGLTIAVLDQLWKIGNGTAELISNYRGFDNVSVSGSEGEECRGQLADGVDKLSDRLTGYKSD